MKSRWPDLLRTPTFFYFGIHPPRWSQQKLKIKQTLFYTTISSGRFNFNCLSQLHKKHNSANSTNVLSMSNWYSIGYICKRRYCANPQIHSISHHQHPKSQFRKLEGGVERLGMILSLSYPGQSHSSLAWLGNSLIPQTCCRCTGNKHTQLSLK